MSDSKKDESWSFQVDSSDVESTKEKKDVKKTSSPASLLNKTSSKKKGKNLSLDYENVPQRVSRSKLAESESGEEEKALVASLGVRFMAGLIDIFVYNGIYFLAMFLNNKGNNLIVTLISALDRPEITNLKAINEVRLGLIYTLMVLVFFVIIPTMTGKTIGKMFFNLIIDDDDGGRIGLIRTFLREMILRPISFLTFFGLISIFFNKKRKTLHDYLLNTVVRKNYF